MNATASTLVAPDVHAARDFTRHLAELLRQEQGAMVSFLLALAECDGRRLWASLGYASLFDYLHRELGLSKSSAWYRSAGAALVLKYPAVVDALADGRLCVSVLAEVRKVITPANAAEILPRFFHRSAREAKEIAVELAPHIAPPRQDVISPVRSIGRTAAAANGRSATQAGVAAVAANGPATIAPQAAPALAPVCRVSPRNVLVQTSEPDAREDVTLEVTGGRVAAGRREEVQPLTADLRRLHVTVTKRWVEKLEAAKAALSHSVPSGSAEAVLEAALDALLEREAKRKGLLVKKPRRPAKPVDAAAGTRRGTARDTTEPARAKGAGPKPPARDSGPTGTRSRRSAIPAHVRREVLLRDEGRCQARLHDGSICGSRTRIEFDHVVPVALGGPPTIENVRLLCHRHNQLAARAVLGDAAMELFPRPRP